MIFIMMTVTINFKETTFNVTFNANPEFKNAIDAIHCVAFVWSKIGTRESNSIYIKYPFLEPLYKHFGNPYYADLIQRNQTIIKAIESYYKVEFNNVNVLPEYKKGYVTKFGAFNTVVNRFNGFKNLIESKNYSIWSETQDYARNKIEQYIKNGHISFSLFKKLDSSYLAYDRQSLTKKLNEVFKDALTKLGAIDTVLVGVGNHIHLYVVLDKQESLESDEQYYYDERISNGLGVQFYYNFKAQESLIKNIEEVYSELHKGGRQYEDYFMYNPMYIWSGSLPVEEKQELPPDDPTMDMSDWLYEKD